jgi:hypothetical protein
VLAMPEREDRRHFWLDLVIDVGRLVAEAVGQPDQPQILGREHTQHALNESAPQQIAKDTFQLDYFAS